MNDTSHRTMNRHERDVFVHWAICLVAMLGMFVAPSHGFQGRSPERDLLIPDRAASRASQRFVGVIRSRVVRIDQRRLNGLRKGDRVTLNLFDRLSLDADITYYRKTHRETQQWAGEIVGRPGSSILLAEAGGSVAGIIRGPKIGEIRIHSAGRGRYEIVQINPQAQAECGNTLQESLIPQQAIDDAIAEKSISGVGGCDTGSVIDVMVVYTDAVRIAAAALAGGDPSAILAEIDLAELDVNTSYENSLINPRINVVHTRELVDGEGLDYFVMLRNLTFTSDGVYDEVHSLRNLHGADMVAMLTTNISLGGVAWIMTELKASEAVWAFSVTNWARAASSVLAHELGHNQGCCHDRDNCGGGIFPYSWGHRLTGDDAILYRTVMSYRPGTWIKHFSNPSVNFAGQPTGQPDTDNARTINETVQTISNYRQSASPPPRSAGPAGLGLLQLLAPDRLANDFFGGAVDTDGTVAVVGAVFKDVAGQSNAGAVYVYRFDGVTWNWEATLTASDAEMDDNFGNSVAISGDVIVVGSAFSDGSAGLDMGAAYVFRFNGSNWSEQEILTPLLGSQGDQFGDSVDVFTDIDGETIVVGASRDDEGGSNAGAVYVYEFDGLGGVWNLQDKLIAFDAQIGDRLGFSVSIDSDLIVTGAFLEDANGEFNAGSAYVFRNIAGTWTEEAIFDAGLEITAGALFGGAVSVTLDSVNGDVVVVGSDGADGILVGGGSVFNSGAAYVFRHDGVNWLSEGQLLVPASVAVDGGGFGWDVSVSETVTTVGVPFSGLGAFIRYQYDGANWIPTTTTTTLADDNLGISVANDFASNTIIAGAWTADSFAGAAYVLSGSAAFADCNENGLPDDCDILEGRSGDCNNNGIPDSCDVDLVNGGTSLDCNFNFIPDECEIALGIEPDCNGNGIIDSCDLLGGTLTDSNGDGFPDECQDCNNNALFDPDEILADPSIDCNFNGIPDECDLASFTSADTNFNLIPDECEDCNSNGIPDFQDILNGMPDLNNNKIPDICDPDCNNNGTPDDYDIENGISFDGNDDGIPDECDPDCDEDGVSDLLQIIQGVREDCNGNLILDICDVAFGISGDCDFSGIPDECEIALGLLDDVNLDGIPDMCQDCNLNGILDPTDILNLTSTDCNLSGIPDECESFDINGNNIPDFCEDCNRNLVPDYIDLEDGLSLDCNGNTIPDECDISVYGSSDCNDNGILDECEIASGIFEDINLDGIPDACQDCNTNGILDPDDILNLTSTDCNVNGVPDECETSDRNNNGIPDFCEDCNRNLIPDYLDIESGSSLDLNANSIPDECDLAGDTNNDNIVNVADLLNLLGGWGPCSTSPCMGDQNFDGVVNVADLLLLLGSWGT